MDDVVQIYTLIYCKGPEAEKIFKSFAFTLPKMPTTLTLSYRTSRSISSRRSTLSMKDIAVTQEPKRKENQLKSLSAHYTNFLNGASFTTEIRWLEVKEPTRWQRSKTAIPRVGIDVIAGKSKHQVSASADPRRQRKPDEQKRQYKAICQRFGRGKSHLTCLAMEKICKNLRNPVILEKCADQARRIQSTLWKDNEDDSDETWVVAVSKKDAKAWFVRMNEDALGQFYMKVDTDAEVNIISAQNTPTPQKTRTTLKTADTRWHIN